MSPLRRLAPFALGRDVLRAGGLALAAACAVLVAASSAPSSDAFALADNTWRRLTLAPSTRYLTPGYRVSPAPVDDPNPRTRAFCGLVAGPDRVFYFGGAHASYPGNDVETFDPAALRWEQSYEPEVCPHVQSAPCYDVYNGWGTMITTPLGRPYAEHTYQVYGYDPSRNRLLAILNNGTWAYDLASRQWTLLAGPNAGNTFSPRGEGTGNRHLLGFDDSLGAFQAVLTTGGGRGVYRFDDGTRKWTKRGATPEPGWSTMYSTYAPKAHAHFVYAPGWSKRWWRYEGGPDRWTPLAPPPVTPDSFDYDTQSGVVVAASHPSQGSFRVMVYDPGTDQWSSLPATGPVPTMASGMSSAPMAWRYVPSRNVFVFLEGHRGPAAGGPTATWFYRYRNGAEPSNTAR